MKTLKDYRSLAFRLQHKADVYLNGRRIYSFEGTWQPKTDGVVFVPDDKTRELQPAKGDGDLHDGHGRGIYV